MVVGKFADNTSLYHDKFQTYPCSTKAAASLKLLELVMVGQWPWAMKEASKFAFPWLRLPSGT